MKEAIKSLTENISEDEIFDIMAKMSCYSIVVDIENSWWMRDNDDRKNVLMLKKGEMGNEYK